MSLTNKQIVLDFIETIWNQQRLDQINQFVAEDYHDYSLLPAIPSNRIGLARWIENTTKAFDHETIIESILEDGDEVAVRISFHVKHIGTWRGLDSTGRHVVVKGFRFFRLKNEKIIAHWALIDGEALQTALTDAVHGCSIEK